MGIGLLALRMDTLFTPAPEIGARVLYIYIYDPNPHVSRMLEIYHNGSTLEKTIANGIWGHRESVNIQYMSKVHYPPIVVGCNAFCTDAQIMLNLNIGRCAPILHRVFREMPFCQTKNVMHVHIYAKGWHLFP